MELNIQAICAIVFFGSFIVSAIDIGAATHQRVACCRDPACHRQRNLRKMPHFRTVTCQSSWGCSGNVLVGLSMTGSARDPALIQISQSGPAFWVGSGNAGESGLLYMFAWGLASILALVYGKHVGRTPPWTQRGSADGQALQV